MANQEISSAAKNRKPGFFYGYIMVVAGFFIMVIGYGALYSFGVFFKPVSAEFGWTRAETSGAYSLYQIVHGLISIISGRLSDRFGPRLVITVCGIFLGLGYLLMSQISTLWQFYLYYGLIVSIGMTSFTPVMSMVARWFTKRRGLMTAIVVSGIGIGTVIMPPISTQLISSYSWSTSYIIIGSIALVVVVIAAQFVKRDPSQMGQLSYGTDKVAAGSLDSGTRGFTFGEAIRTGQFWVFGVAVFSLLFAQQIVMVHIVPHATDLGISAVSAASILSVIGGLSIAGRLGLGSASDRIGSKSSLVIALALVSISLFLLLGARDMWMFSLFAVIFGVGYGGIIALQSPIIAESFGLRSHGVILGMLIFIATIGGAIGPLTAGRIYDISGNYQPAFLTATALSVIGFVLAFMFRFKRRKI